MRFQARCTAEGSWEVVDTERKALIELDARDFYIPNSLQAPAQLSTPTFDALGHAEQEKVRGQYTEIPGKWTNAKNDALGLYNHLAQVAHTTHPEQAIFVTNDGNFLKQSRATALHKLSFPGQIRRPAEAVTFLHTITRTSLPDL